jgi:hypothetical protein
MTCDYCNGEIVAEHSPLINVGAIAEPGYEAAYHLDCWNAANPTTGDGTPEVIPTPDPTA